jgi:hypothetical protein
VCRIGLVVWVLDDLLRVQSRGLGPLVSYVPVVTTPLAEPGLPGQLGDFAIVGVLGTGGSGVVLDARWGHREIALKVLHPTLIVTPREKAQFLEEARRLQDISHPGVVKVLASGELPDGRPYLAMEKLEGPTLAAKLAGQGSASGALPLTRALTLFEQLAGAVQALHDRGLVHRDLKPENVVLVGDTHAVLLDFGIAKELAAPASTTTQDGGVRGTPAYMAPERFFGQPASVATDVYELAVMLYAMLAGSLPWADCGDPEVRLNPASLGDAVPAAVDVEIRRALSTRAQNRPASARELAAGVLAAAGLPAPAAPRTTTQVPLGPPGSGPAWFEKHGKPGEDKGATPLAWAPTATHARHDTSTARRRRVWWPVAAVAVAAAAAVIGWIVVKSDDTPSAPAPAPGSAIAGATTGSGAIATGSDNDPWAVKEAPLPPPARPVAELRREMTTAVGRLPGDTRTVVALGIAEMRADRDFGAILEAAAKRPEVQLMFGEAEGCAIGLADIDWIVLGFAEPGVHRQGEVVVSGRWSKEQLEACLVAIADGSAKVDAATGMTRIDGTRNDFWVGMDGAIAVISTRDDGTASAVAALVGRIAGPEGVTGALVKTLARDATAWIVVDADDADTLDQLSGLPAGADVGLWARIEGGLTGNVLGRFRSVGDAKKAEKYMQAQLAKAMEDGGDLLGKFEVTRKDRDVAMTAWITPLTMGLAANAITAPD